MKGLPTHGDRIRAYREARGLNGSELGAKVGVSRSAISMIENGRTDPCLTTFIGIARALGVRLDDLVPDAPQRTGKVIDVEAFAAEKRAERIATAEQRVETARRLLERAKNGSRRSTESR